jgi:uncharacterized protein
MRVFRKSAWLLAVLFSLSSMLAAVDATSPHEQAARELYDLIGGKSLATQAGNAMVEQLASNPALAPYQDILKGWVQGIFAGGAFDDEMVRLYQETFTESELREIVAFYKTPIGQKTLQKLPELMQKGVAVGQKLATEHMPELQKAIAARQRELDKGEEKKER